MKISVNNNKCIITIEKNDTPKTCNWLINNIINISNINYVVKAGLKN